jgi:hypothetical protein
LSNTFAKPSNGSDDILWNQITNPTNNFYFYDKYNVKNSYLLNDNLREFHIFNNDFHTLIMKSKVINSTTHMWYNPESIISTFTSTDNIKL